MYAIGVDEFIENDLGTIDLGEQNWYDPDGRPMNTSELLYKLGVKDWREFPVPTD